MTQREAVSLAVVRNVTLFQKLPEQQQREVATRMRERRYRKGTIIFQEGDEGSTLSIICSGRVRIYLAGPGGREATVRICRPYSTFGEFAVLDGAPRSANAEALDDVTVLILHRDTFIELLRGNFDMVLQVLILLTERLRDTTNYSEQLAFLDRSGRVAAALLRLADAEPQVAGPVRLDLTQQELAGFTNTTREWVNRILRDFADLKLIRLERGAVVVVDREGLRRKIE
jgi:CRP/FNR family transcriptional regulator, cyclic AMP receptor protein